MQATTSISGGQGQINAYIFGVNMFNTQINTCGAGQQIDVDGLTTGVFDALNCPTSTGGHVALGFVLPIPGEAAGLGTINITLSASDQASRAAYCIDLVATV